MAWKGNTSNPVPNVSQESENRSDKSVDVNRAHQTRNDVDPRIDQPKVWKIGLQDIDTAIHKHLEKLQLSVIDNGNQINVPVFYGSPEKWKSIKSDGCIRDYNGKLILPAIIFQRTSSDKDTSMMMFNRYLHYDVMRLYSEKNKYTKFSIQNPKNAPVNEIYRVTMPDHMIFTYQMIIWTEYTQQMNSLVERLNFEADDYWGENRNFRFRVYLDSIVHTTEVSVDDDRMVKSEFDLKVRGYLLPEQSTYLTGNKLNTNRLLTVKKIIISPEIVPTGFDPNNTISVNSKWRNQNFPNLAKDEFIQEPTVSLSGFKVIDSIAKAFGNKEFHKVPSSSTDIGQEGWVSYDSDYYYVYTNGKWKRVPISIFDGAPDF